MSMTKAIERLKGLVKKWREDSMACCREGTEYRHGEETGLIRCADDIEAVLGEPSDELPMVDDRINATTGCRCCWCYQWLPLVASAYEYCPKCKGSFSFSKPLLPNECAAQAASEPQEAEAGERAESQRAVRSGQFQTSKELIDELRAASEPQQAVQLAPGQIWWDEHHQWCDGCQTADVVYLLLSGDVDKALYGHERTVWSAVRFWWSSHGFMGAGTREPRLFEDADMRKMTYAGSIEQIKGFRRSPASEPAGERANDDDSSCPKSEPGKYGAIEIRAPDGELDEIVLSQNGVQFHLEQMSDGCWWFSLTDADGHMVHCNLWGTGRDIRAMLSEPESEVVARAEYHGICTPSPAPAAPQAAITTASKLIVEIKRGNTVDYALASALHPNAAAIVKNITELCKSDSLGLEQVLEVLESAAPQAEPTTEAR